MYKSKSDSSETANHQDTNNAHPTSAGKRAGKSNEKKSIHTDDECDSIGDLIGHYGKWQFLMTLLLTLFQVPNTFHIYSPTFQVSVLFLTFPNSAQIILIILF